eukprot:GHVS01047011.1.p1 GENE.GHVS01047011.1~~GHVS01047011.1.p1  ORF type:complete len:109 (-),score=9.63 GHVS01047011.1:242-568(-)
MLICLYRLGQSQFEERTDNGVSANNKMGLVASQFPAGVARVSSPHGFSHIHRGSSFKMATPTVADPSENLAMEYIPAKPKIHVAIPSQTIKSEFERLPSSLKLQQAGN